MSQITFAILGAPVFCSVYLAGRAVRHVFAPVARNGVPRERIRLYLVVFGMMGAFAGWLAYEPVAAVRQCYVEGKPVIACAFFPGDDARPAVPAIW